VVAHKTNSRHPAGAPARTRGERGMRRQQAIPQEDHVERRNQRLIMLPPEDVRSTPEYVLG
jgi:hypothetical protein